MVKKPSANSGDITQVQSMGWEDPLEEGIAIHPCTLAWRIPRTEEPGRPQPTGPQDHKESEVTEASDSTHVDR